MTSLNQNSITRNKILEAQIRYAVGNFCENIQISEALRKKQGEGYKNYKYLTRDEHCECCGELNGKITYCHFRSRKF